MKILSKIRSLKFAIYKFLGKFIPYFKRTQLMGSQIMDSIETILKSYLTTNDIPYKIKYRYIFFPDRLQKYVPHRLSFVFVYKQNIFELLIEYYLDNNEITYRLYHPTRVNLFEDENDANILSEFYIKLKTLNPLIEKTFRNFYA